MKQFLLWWIVASIMLPIFAQSDVLAVSTREGVIVSESPSNGAGGDNYCGDTVTRNGEQCDDGNNRNGDGCDSNCKNELLTNEKQRPYNVDQKLCPSSCNWSNHYQKCE